MTKKLYTRFLEVYNLTVSEIMKLIEEVYEVPQDKFIVQHEPPKVHVEIANRDNILFSVEMFPLLKGVKLLSKSSGSFAEAYLLDFAEEVTKLNRAKGARLSLVKQQPKPGKQKNIRYYDGVHGMLEKIAHRDYYIRQNKESPKWSHRWDGSIDNKTANSIDRDLGGRIKGQWKNIHVSGEELVGLLFERYPDYKYLKPLWKELKKKEF